jgi:hypothetical protein
MQTKTSREFIAAKSCRDTHVGVVQRNVIRPEDRGERAVQYLRNPPARRLAGDNHAGLLKFFTEGSEITLGKLVEDQIPDDHRIVCVPAKRAQILAMPRHTGRPFFRLWPQIETRHADSAARQPGSQFAGAGADLERGVGRPHERRDRLFQPAMIPDDEIGEPKIPPIVQRIGVIVGQGIEQFRLKRALHAMIVR